MSESCPELKRSNGCIVINGSLLAGVGSHALSINYFLVFIGIFWEGGGDFGNAIPVFMH